MDGMKLCRTCKVTIAKSARVCPGCGAKQGRGLLGKLIAVFVVVIGISMAAHDGNAASKAVQPTDIRSYTVGTPFIIEDIEINVMKVAKLTSIAGNILWSDKTPSAGGVFVAVKWSLRNVGSVPVNSFSLPSAMQLVSANGATYDQDIGATTQLAGAWNINSKTMSNLNPKITVEEVAVFEIAKELVSQDGWMIKIGGIRMPLTYTK